MRVLFREGISIEFVLDENLGGRKLGQDKRLHDNYFKEYSIDVEIKYK